MFWEIDFPKLVKSENELLKEALIDMCKQLLSLFKSSQVILNISLDLIQFGLSLDPDKSSYLNLWIKLMRNFSFETNPEGF